MPRIITKITFYETKHIDEAWSVRLGDSTSHSTVLDFDFHSATNSMEAFRSGRRGSRKYRNMEHAKSVGKKTASARWKVEDKLKAHRKKIYERKHP